MRLWRTGAPAAARALHRARRQGGFAAFATAALIACVGCGPAAASSVTPGEETPADRAPAGPAECRTASGGSYLGVTDRNPANAIPQPKLGSPLVGRRPDGHVQFGLNDPSYLLRDTQPRIGLNAADDALAHKLVGSSLIRVTLHWGWLARKRGWIEWGDADRVYCNNVRHGIAPVLALFGSPKWAVTGGSVCDGYCFTPPDQRYDGELREFAEKAAIRYPRVAAIEAWNEPNLELFWHSPVPRGPGPDPARYTQVLRTVFEGVKSGNPNTIVLGGSLSDAETQDAGASARGIPLAQFLSAMYDNGARRWMDGLSFHPYPWKGPAMDLFHKTLNTVRSTVAARDPGRRLWPDELGAGTGVNDGGFTEAEQDAEMLRDYQELDAAPDVDVVIFHSMIDNDHWGWLKPRDEAGRVFPRPVFCSFVERYGALARGDNDAVATLPVSSHAKKKKKKQHKKRKTKRKHAKRHTTSKKHKSKPRKRARAVAARMDCSKPLPFSG